MKKGFIGDIVVYLIALFVMALVFLILYHVVASVNTSFQSNSGITPESKSIIGNFKNSFAGVYDKVYLLLVIGYFIVILMLAYFLRSYPAFAFITFIILLVFGIIAVHFANSYFDVASNPTFMAEAAEFSMMNFLATKLPHLIIAFGAIFIIVLYAKSGQSGGL